MQAHDLLRLLHQHEAEIVKMIQSGAGWEIALQAALWNWVIELGGFSAGRELPYGAAAGDRRRLDLGIGDGGGGRAAVELKVESAAEAGKGLAAAMNADLAKIRDYAAAPNKWVVVIAYTSKSAQALIDSGKLTNFIQGTNVFFGLSKPR
jgi:hypothetical protein